MNIKTVEIEMYPDGRMDNVNAAKYLGLHPGTLNQMRVKATGPEFIKVGKKVFYFKADLDAWLVSNGKRRKSGRSSGKTLQKGGK